MPFHMYIFVSAKMGGRLKKLLSCIILALFLFFHTMAGATLDRTVVREKTQIGEVAALDGGANKSKINCDFACARRCAKASRKNICSRACGACCLQCQCVPPGTYGNKELCPCYANLKTKGLKPKCP